MVQRIKNKENLELLAEKIRQVDVVVIGGGSGLSSAAGYNHYHWMPYLEGQLQDFIIAILHQNNSGLFTHAIYKACGMLQRGRPIMTWRKL